MDRIELPHGYAEIRQAKNTEGVGYELTFNVAAGSALDLQLEGCFHSGDLLPLPHAGEDLSVSPRTQTELEGSRVYEGTAGFLRPGMGGAGG